MVLDVISIVEEGEVVDTPVVAGGSSRVLEVSVEVAKQETERDAGQVDRHEELRSSKHESSPKRKYPDGVERGQRTPSHARCGVAMMGEMALSPDILWNADQHAQIEGVQPVRCS